jgi:hypothetical protein
LFELGQLMAGARTRRIFDARRQRIYELTQIGQWFMDKNLARNGDLPYFTTLSDNWLYSFFNERCAGSRFSIGLSPGVNSFRWHPTMGDVQTGLNTNLNMEYHLRKTAPPQPVLAI